MSNIYPSLVALLGPVFPVFMHLLVQIRGLDVMGKESLDWLMSLGAFYLSLNLQHVRTVIVQLKALL